MRGALLVLSLLACLAGVVTDIWIVDVVGKNWNQYTQFYYAGAVFLLVCAFWNFLLPATLAAVSATGGLFVFASMLRTGFFDKVEMPLVKMMYSWVSQPLDGTSRAIGIGIFGVAFIISLWWYHHTD
ncbi:MAG: hypothetical protein ACTSYA_06640 [Candidatus Kariarchaeaceae archaeon]